MASLRDGRLKTYASKAAFIADPETGVQRELAFWDGLRSTAPLDDTTP